MTRSTYTDRHTLFGFSDQYKDTDCTIQSQSGYFHQFRMEVGAFLLFTIVWPWFKSLYGVNSVYWRFWYQRYDRRNCFTGHCACARGKILSGYAIAFVNSSNADLPGLWVFKVDGGSIEIPRHTGMWMTWLQYYTESTNSETRVENTSHYYILILHGLATSKQSQYIHLAF